jgi:hypothetical protein
MNRRQIFSAPPEPPSLAKLAPTLVKVRPSVRLVPTAYPVLLVPLPDRHGEPDGAQRVRSGLKDLLRHHRVRAQWLAEPRDAVEPTIAASEPSTPQTSRDATESRCMERSPWVLCAKKPSGPTQGIATNRD